jgi:tRNA-dihydrouridine synthase B
MIGRAAQGRPWIFREIDHFLRTGQYLPPASLDEQQQILTDHLSALHAFYGAEHGARIARKHVSWYLQTLPGATEFRREFNRITDAHQQHIAIAHYFARLLEGDLAA